MIDESSRACRNGGSEPTPCRTGDVDSECKARGSLNLKYHQTNSNERYIRKSSEEILRLDS